MWQVRGQESAYTEKGEVKELIDGCERSIRDSWIPGQSSLRNTGAKIFMRIKQGK